MPIFPDEIPPPYINCPKCGERLWSPSLPIHMDLYHTDILFPVALNEPPEEDHEWN